MTSTQAAFLSLSGRMLIAMPALEDPNFHKAVVLICEHTPEGALGLIVNRPVATYTVGQALAQMGIDCHNPAVAARFIYWGGPVQGEVGSVLHRPLGQWHTTLAVETTNTGMTVSRDILEAITQGEGPRDFMLMTGYAGWGEGQLEEEIKENTWIVAPFASEVLFDQRPELGWTPLLGQFGGENL